MDRSILPENAEDDRSKLWRFERDAASPTSTSSVHGADEPTPFREIAAAVERLIGRVPDEGTAAEGEGVADTHSSLAPCLLVNIGAPIGLLSLIERIERCLGKTAIRSRLTMQLGDVPVSSCDHRLFEALSGYHPTTGMEEGVERFVPR